MIAADTSTGIAFLEGSTGRDVQLLDKALEERKGANGASGAYRTVERPEASFGSRRNAFRSTHD